MLEIFDSENGSESLNFFFAFEKYKWKKKHKHKQYLKAQFC